MAYILHINRKFKTQLYNACCNENLKIIKLLYEPSSIHQTIKTANVLSKVEKMLDIRHLFLIQV